MPLTLHVDDLPEKVGATLGVSDWREIGQPLIDAFADVTGDRQWIHTEPDRAADGPFGSTVAHGLLTLSLIPALAAEVFHIDGVRSRINYGYDRVRFPEPVRVGGRIRNRVTLDDLSEVRGASGPV